MSTVVQRQWLQKRSAPGTPVERYAAPLTDLVDEVATLSAKVDEHLKRMGASWN